MRSTISGVCVADTFALDELVNILIWMIKAGHIAGAFAHVSTRMLAQMPILGGDKR